MQKKINITKILYFYIIIFLGILIIFCAVNLNPNNDMWWMISTGKYIVQNNTIPKINPFTIHNGYRIIVQQWLTAIFNYEIYIHFGNSGFITTAILMTVLSLFLCYRYISIFTNDINTKMLLISVAAFVFAAFAATRPTIFTIPVVLLELTNLEKWNRDKNKIRYLIPLIFFVHFGNQYSCSVVASFADIDASVYCPGIRFKFQILRYRTHEQEVSDRCGYFYVSVRLSESKWH